MVLQISKARPIALCYGTSDRYRKSRHPPLTPRGSYCTVAMLHEGLFNRWREVASRGPGRSAPDGSDLCQTCSAATQARHSFAVLWLSNNDSQEFLTRLLGSHPRLVSCCIPIPCGLITQRSVVQIHPPQPTLKHRVTRN